ncbi:MAG: transporter substrate-binding domain-containing protein [Anaerolineae bacterium]|nr:transporter substrate-binding domain-containing protein [Anaerolineae bacterium]
MPTSHSTTPTPLTISQVPVTGVDVGLAAIYYDGVSVMVDSSAKIASLEDLEDTTVCTLADSQSAQELDAEMLWRDLGYDAVSFPTIAEMRAAFEDGRCVAQVLDRSLLEIIQQSSDNPGSSVVWPVPLTAQPIRPLLPYGDPQWKNIVDWTIWGLVEAEKLGITSQNIGQFMRRTNEADAAYGTRVGESVARLIDAQSGLGSSLGLTNGYMAQVIAEVGNYGEIYDRNLGPESALVIERGLNALWRDGGLMEASAWR